LLIPEFVIQNHFHLLTLAIIPPFFYDTLNISIRQLIRVSQVILFDFAFNKGERGAFTEQGEERFSLHGISIEFDLYDHD